MLRALVLVLVLVNAVFWAWTQGQVPWLGLLPEEAGREPQRVARQQDPQALRLLPDATMPARRDPATTDPAASASAPNAQDNAASDPLVGAVPSAASAVLDADAAASSASEPGSSATAIDAASAGAAALPSGSCLEAGPFAGNELAAIEAALLKVAQRRDWVVQAIDSPGVWLIYMGVFSSRQESLGKQGELRRLGIGFEEVLNPPELRPGLSLGRFSEGARANERLAELRRKGINSARVIAATNTRTLHVVRLPQPSSALQAKLAQMDQGLLGKSFVPCAKP